MLLNVIQACRQRQVAEAGRSAVQEGAKDRGKQAGRTVTWSSGKGGKGRKGRKFIW